MRRLLLGYFLMLILIGVTFAQWEEDELGNIFNTNPQHVFIGIPEDGEALYEEPFVGIGTKLPQYLLDVNGIGRFVGNLYVDGKIGIGTQSPIGKLDVRGQIVGGFGAMTTSGVTNWNDITNIRPGSGYTLLRGNADNGPSEAGNKYFHSFNFEYGPTKAGAGNLTQLAIPYGSENSINQGMFMRGRYGGTWSNWIRIISENTSGNVGIGTTNPSEKLEVNGDIKWGAYGACLKTDQGASIELKGTGIPYIDFTNDSSTDYDVRFILQGDDILEITGGNVGIGTSNPSTLLTVDGIITAEEIIVEDVTGADFVFEDDYNLKSLNEVENFIHNNKHLPDIPSAEEVAENGVSLGEMQSKLLQKVEELTLYMIELKKENQDQQRVIEELRMKIEK